MAGELMAEGPRPADLAIGIDFGGSGIKGAVVDVKTGKFVGDRIRIPTPQPSVPRDVVALMDRLTRMLIEALPPIGGLTPADAAAVPVGVGVPAATRGGVVLTAANIDRAWIGYSAERELALAMGRIVAIGNDADVAGMAELRFGAGRRQRGTIIVLTIGTGLGTALFADGKLLPNTELGHIELNGGDAELRVAESARDRFNMGWKEWAGGFNEYLLMMERLFWPDLFILGGGASKRSDNYMQYLTVKTPVAIATLKNNAGIVGGALIAQEKRTRDAAKVTEAPLG
jgi:polyphosphate glucokinase